MRIKADFITNSSSTAYIVLISETMNEIKDVSVLKDLSEYEDELYHTFRDDENEMVKTMNDSLDRLKQGERLYSDEIAGFWTLINYVERMGAVFKRIDMTGGGDSDMIEPLSIDDIHKALNRMQQNEIEN